MSSPRWRKVFRDLTGHPVRTALVVLSIAVGVFTVSVIMGGREVLIREFEADFRASVAPSVEFDTSGFDDGLPKQVAERHDVLAAEGRRNMAMRFAPGEVGKNASTAGWETLQLSAVPDFDRSGVQKIVREEASSWPPRPGEIILEKSALMVDSFSAGDVVTVEGAASKRCELRVAGFAHDINTIPAQFQGAIAGYISMDTLQSLGEHEVLNHLSVVLDPTLSRQAATRIAADIRDTDLAAAGVQTLLITVPEPGSHFLGDIFKALTTLLLVIGLTVLGLSGFLVITTVSAIMTQQVRQLGIMKSIGARRIQVEGMYLALVVSFGVIAVFVGLLAGRYACQALIEYAAGILNFRVTDMMPPVWVMVLNVAVGMFVPVAAAAWPITRGTRMRVVRALNAANEVPRFGYGFVDRILGAIKGLPRPVALSLRNTFLRKGRLALTLLTLVLASAVVMAVLTVRTSMLQTVDDMGSWWNYDAQVFLARPLPSESVEREAKRVPGVTATETWIQAQASLMRPDGTENQGIYVLGLPADTKFIKPELTGGRWLEPDVVGEVVVNADVLSEEPGIRLGDTIRLGIRGVEDDWKVVGVVAGQMMGPIVFVDRKVLDAEISAGGAVTRLLVQASEHTIDAQVRTARDLETRLDDASLPISGSQTQQAQKKTYASQLGILITFLVVLAGLLASVGVIGLTGTMTMNVLESTREIGVMRSVGASHASIFGIYITEGVVVAVMAWMLGAVISWPLSRVLNTLLAGALGLQLSYRFSVEGVLLWLVLVVAIAVFASMLPAWRASRVSIRDAISYE
ncbi:MAG: ABC transporter permease [Coriobacteriia bacterium]|nr:ABC transporter permease [Coriobacteriia bacterium]